MNEVDVLRAVIYRIEMRMKNEHIPSGYGFSIEEKTVELSGRVRYILKCESCSNNMSFSANVAKKYFDDGTGLFLRKCNACGAEFLIHAHQYGEILND